jgi:hypothetical protein
VCKSFSLRYYEDFFIFNLLCELHFNLSGISAFGRKYHSKCCKKSMINLVNIKIKWYEQKSDWYEKRWFIKLFVNCGFGSMCSNFWNEFLTEYCEGLSGFVCFWEVFRNFFASWKYFWKLMVMSLKKWFWVSQFFMLGDTGMDIRWNSEKKNHSINEDSPTKNFKKFQIFIK